ncbi:hypothetical protein [Nocardioides humi]|uniref:hypothetical protein n=1 Tax=Nocardioides humi TaxID=449461 RepID=UPI0031E447D3
MAVEATAIPTIFVPIEGEACEPIWQILRAEIARQQRNGGQVRPAVARAVERLRKGAQDHLTLQAMFAREHVSGPVTNITPESATSELISTNELADRLHVTPTHARRLARDAGIEPAARNAWRPVDADQLVTQRGHQR